MPQARDVSEGGIATHGFEQAVAAQSIAFGIEDGVEQAAVHAAAREDGHAQRPHRFLLRQADQILRELRNANDIQGQRNLLRAVHLRQHVFYAGEQFVCRWQAQLKWHRIAAQIRGQFQGGGSDDDGTALGAEFLGQFAQAAADAIVVAVTREILQEENGIALNQRDIGDGLLRIIRTVDRRAVRLGQARGDAPGVERDGELCRDLHEQLLDAFLFRRFYRDDGVA